MGFLNYLQDTISLFYPRICPGCGQPMQVAEKEVCVYCLVKLPRTGFESGTDNPVEKIFRGRLDIVQASAFLNFRKEGLAQSLMHELKYKGNKELGFFLGTLFAREISGGLSIKPDLITTVPLHAEKFRKRGFNQSDEIARGFAEQLDIPFVPGLLKRTKNTETQTLKKRFERWENTADSFSLTGIQNIDGNHIGLLDDVITTGATLESCGQALSQTPGVRVSIFSLCFAIH
jgi:ComF family protein